MKVVVSDQVRAFLISERNYLKQHSATAGERLTRRMREATRMLAEFPKAGPASPLAIPRMRRLVVDEYVLDYEIVGREIHMLNTRHGRQRDLYIDYDDGSDFETDPD